MSVLVFDADGLIKLVRSGLFPRLKQTCFISQEVFEETVVEGKKRLYPDALIIEELIRNKLLHVRQTKPISPVAGLGKGELSALALCTDEDADAIVSDDQRFLHHLHELRIPFLVPTECVVSLAQARMITVQEGKDALIKLKAFVKKENYESALVALGGIS